MKEANELINAPREDLLNEMADVLELLKSLVEHYEINWQIIEQTQVAKRAKRGSFKKRLFLIWSTPADSK